MALLANPRVQEVMTAMMQKGPDGAAKLMANDPEARSLLAQLQKAMISA
jgi:hypothetical protein